MKSPKVSPAAPSLAASTSGDDYVVPDDPSNTNMEDVKDDEGDELYDPNVDEAEDDSDTMFSSGDEWNSNHESDDATDSLIGDIIVEDEDIHANEVQVEMPDGTFQWVKKSPEEIKCDDDQVLEDLKKSPRHEHLTARRLARFEYIEKTYTLEAEMGDQDEHDFGESSRAWRNIPAKNFIVEECLVGPFIQQKARGKRLVRISDEEMIKLNARREEAEKNCRCTVCKKRRKNKLYMQLALQNWDAFNNGEDIGGELFRKGKSG